MKAVLGCVCDLGLQTGRVRQADPCWAGKFRHAGQVGFAVHRLTADFNDAGFDRQMQPRDLSAHNCAGVETMQKGRPHARRDGDIGAWWAVEELVQGCYVRAKDTADVGCPHK